MHADEINALPERVRRYIHHLETMADPAGLVRENAALREQVHALAAMVLERERDGAAVCAAPVR